MDRFLGCTFYSGRHGVKRRIAPQARVRLITQRSRGASLEQVITAFRCDLTGWHGDFGFSESPRLFKRRDEWIRHRQRCLVWKQRKRGPKRYRERRALGALGVGKALAAQTAGTPHGPWRLSNSPALTKALGNRYLASLGLPSLCS